jgi:hypothetical protein
MASHGMAAVYSTGPIGRILPAACALYVRVTGRCHSYLALGRAHDALSYATAILDSDGGSYKALLLQGGYSRTPLGRVLKYPSRAGTHVPQ